MGREILFDLLSAPGASVVRLGRSEKFIPVDTEAIREEDIRLAQKWSKEYKLDAIVSTDGGADRPLVEKEFPTENPKNCIAQLIGNDDALSYQAIEAAFGELCGKVENTGLTDGLRITFQNGEIIHLRPSGKAPEFRCYNEADSLIRVESETCMEIISKWGSVRAAFYPSDL